MKIQTLWGEKEVLSRPCIYCKKDTPLSEFPKHIANKDNLDKRCKKCIKEHTRVRSALKRNAPPKPERCECCGKEPKDFRNPNKWVIDHDHKTKQFRGWICDACNVGIGTLGDDIDGLQKAIEYLSRV